MFDDRQGGKEILAGELSCDDIDKNKEFLIFILIRGRSGGLV